MRDVVYLAVYQTVDGYVIGEDAMDFGRVPAEWKTAKTMGELSNLFGEYVARLEHGPSWAMKEGTG